MAEVTSPDEFPEGAKGGKYLRGALNAAGGLIPFAGGLIAAAASTWGEHEQDRMNEFFRHWIEMLRTEMEEKQRTIVEVMQRLDLRDEETSQRIMSQEYQSLLRKSFRDWAGAESEDKRSYVRNLLSNAAATKVCSDDVVRLFLDWVRTFSELHLIVIGKFYNNSGLTRSQLWSALGREAVREDSADADVFKLVIRDLSTGGIIRQHRPTDYAGNFIKKPAQRSKPGMASSTYKSAFDDGDSYELTALGRQFVHYAMTEVPIKLTYEASDNSN
jgi:hypothetical protein